MSFNSIQFLVFFPVVTFLYFALPFRLRWAMLLIASSIFYMAFIPAYILILFFTITVDYLAGRLIYKTQGKRRRLYLTASIAANLGVLGFFKYFDFIGSNLTLAAHALGWKYSLPVLSLVIPIGLSFHTFQAMSYTIEIYRGNQRPEKHFGIFALYVMFYPQLVAGPIERPQNLLHQFYERHCFEYQRVVGGLKLMLWGMFKKIVIADRLAVFVDQVYNHPTSYQGIPLIVATLFFAFQIYCDFSAYSDIAIGAAQVMGFRLMTNFNRPYGAKSIADFWRRWHISLTTWLRDYVYLPLIGNHGPRQALYASIFITFLISGIWHGARWTFVVWGALNGLYILTSIWTRNIRRAICNIFELERVPRFHAALQIAVTFSLTCFAWVFFRANSLSDAYYIVRNLFTGTGYFLTHLGLRETWANILPGQQPSDILIAVIPIIFMWLIHLIQPHHSIRNMFSEKPIFFRWAMYYALLLSIICFGAFEARQFIYFQF
ncbi:MAG TPA: MBOAT family O-acyltransferase [Pyrinomonadaceae bacterium]|nr:MBOAT family O-acyltransferase [Pyrinomonadaceae bacterium]